MNRGFSQAAASRTAAIDAVRHKGERVEASSVRRTVFAPMNVRAQDLHDQAAGQA